MDSLKNIVFGVVVFVVGIGLLSWNEHRAVQKYQELHDVRDNVLSVSTDTISPVHEGKPVYVSGDTATESVLKDPLFNVEAQAIRLRRKVEMYQWQEQKTTAAPEQSDGASQDPSGVSYRKVWSERLIDSSAFKESGHENPTVMHPEGWSDVADKVTLGSFTLSQEAISRLTTFQPYPVFRATLPEGARLEDSVILIGSEGGVADIGDKRISFEIVPQGPVSVIAAQKGSVLAPWRRSRGTKYLLIQQGTYSAEEMLGQAKSNVSFLTWIFRAVGGFLMAFGVTTVLNPLSVMKDVVPFFGYLLGRGVRIFSVLSSAVVALSVIGIAWVATRPFFGLTALAGAVGFLVWIGFRAHKNKLARKATKVAKT